MLTFLRARIRVRDVVYISVVTSADACRVANVYSVTGDRIEAYV